MKRIYMLKTDKGSPDGVNIHTMHAGQVYETQDSVADGFITDGVAILETDYLAKQAQPEEQPVVVVETATAPAFERPTGEVDTNDPVLVDALDIGQAAITALKDAGYLTIDSLKGVSAETLIALPKIGISKAQIIVDAVNGD